MNFLILLFFSSRFYLPFFNRFSPFHLCVCLIRRRRRFSSSLIVHLGFPPSNLLLDREKMRRLRSTYNEDQPPAKSRFFCTLVLALRFFPSHCLPFLKLYIYRLLLSIGFQQPPFCMRLEWHTLVACQASFTLSHASSRGLLFRLLLVKSLTHHLSPIFF